LQEKKLIEYYKKIGIMCYYNGQKITHEEFIRLGELEKTVSKYDFLHRDLQIGFDYSLE
jgi:hypothetical protein